jgi:hypothetical protein
MDHADLEAAPAAEELDLGYRDDPIAPHVEAIMAHLGEDVKRPCLVQTPRRFAAAMRFLAGGYEADLETVVGSGVFDAEGQGLMLVRDVEDYALDHAPAERQRCRSQPSSAPKSKPPETNPEGDTNAYASQHRRASHPPHARPHTDRPVDLFSRLRPDPCRRQR